MMDLQQANQQVKQPTCKPSMQTNNPQGFKLTNLHELMQGPRLNVCPLDPRQQQPTHLLYSKGGLVATAVMTVRASVPKT